jgi:hypothetical protein
MATSLTEQHMEERYPMTEEQRNALTRDLLSLRGKIEEIIILMTACYGPGSQASFRAGEISSSLQRFEWELERQLAKAAPPDCD